MPRKNKSRKNSLTNFLLFFLLIVICLFIFVFINDNKTKTISITTPTITAVPIVDITWDQALSLLDECQIQSIFERRNLEVFLYDKDNHTFKTTEPKRGDIIYKINHLPSTCPDTIKTITE